MYRSRLCLLWADASCVAAYFGNVLAVHFVCVCVFRLRFDLWGMFLGIVWVWRRCLLCVGYLVCFIRGLESGRCG